MAEKILMFGNIGKDVPELRFSPSGTAVCTFRFVQSDRIQNKETKEWTDRQPELWLRVSVFGPQAENIVEADYQPGTRVAVYGNLRQEPDWEDREGNKRYGGVEFVADEVLASNRWAVARSERRGQGAAQQRPAQQNQQPRQQAAPQASAPPANDPWAAQQQAPQAAPAASAPPANDPWSTPANQTVADPWAAQ